MQEQVPVSQRKTGFSFDLGFVDGKMIALALINVIATLLVYVPFLNDFSVITMYWDGPLYMYVAKMFYFAPANPFNLPNYYFACNLVLFPLLIRAFSFIGYDHSMLFVVIASTTLATLVFYRLLKDFNYSINPFWASIVFIFFPSRCSYFWSSRRSIVIRRTGTCSPSCWPPWPRSPRFSASSCSPPTLFYYCTRKNTSTCHIRSSSRPFWERTF